MTYQEWNDKKLESLIKARASSIDRGEIERVVVANLHLDRVIGRKMEKATLEKQESYLLERKDFLEAISEARDELGISGKAYIKELDVNDWINAHYDSVSFYGLIKSTLQKLGLGNEWNFYITMYVVNNQPPDRKYAALRSNSSMSVDGVSETGELLIKLRPGLRKEDYLKAWEAFSSYLGSPSRLPKFNTESNRDKAIYADFNNGLTKRELASKYFPNQEELSAIDRVSKILKRQKARRHRDS